MRRIFALLLFAGIVTAIALAQEQAGEKADIPPRESIVRTPWSESVRNANGTVSSRIYTFQKFGSDETGTTGAEPAVRESRSGKFTQVIEAETYRYRFVADSPLAGHRFEHGPFFVTYTPAGDWTGKISTVNLLEDGIKETVSISSAAGSAVSWVISTNAALRRQGNAVLFSDDSGATQFLMPAPSAMDAAGRVIPVTVTLADSVLTCELDTPKTVTWPITLDPTTTINTRTDGRVYYSGNPVYANARDASSGTSSGNYIHAGQWLNTGPLYYVYRSFLSFPLPNIGTAQACTLFVYGEYDQTSANDFNIYLLGAHAYGPTLDNLDYTRFNGHQTGGADTGTILNNAWNTSSYSSNWNKIIFNAAGLDSLKISANDTLRIAMISQYDYSNTPPTGEEYVVFYSSGTPNKEPYLSLTYTPGHIPPAGFTMTALDDSTIACVWNDVTWETSYDIVSWPDTTVIHSLAANAVTDTITGLSPNAQHIWSVAADSTGIKGYSVPDTCRTLLPHPQKSEVAIMPISSDTLRISLPAPPNSTSGLTGMDVDWISGSGGTDSGWLNGQYTFKDGGVNSDSTVVYRVRLRNGDGIATDWSPAITYRMHGHHTLTLYLPGDSGDDYNLNGSAGFTDSTVVRAGKSNTGQRYDGFLSFPLPWYIQKGGVDSLFLTMRRTTEESLRTPALQAAAIPVKGLVPVETLDLGAQDSTSATVPWTISSGTGAKKSPNLRTLFRIWQDLPPFRDHSYGFGIRLKGSSAADSSRAAFLDASNPTYANDTYLTIYYTPGNPDSLDAAPDGFSLTAEGPDSITARWNDNSALESGFLLLNASDLTVVSGTDTLAENTTSRTVGGLIPDTPYRWLVKAFTPANDSLSSEGAARTSARIPGIPTVIAISGPSLSFTLDPRDNPSYTMFAVQDSITGRYIDASSPGDTLRAGPPGDWGWRTFAGWGAAGGDTLLNLPPDSLFVLRAKARTSE